MTTKAQRILDSVTEKASQVGHAAQVGVSEGVNAAKAAYAEYETNAVESVELRDEEAPVIEPESVDSEIDKLTFGEHFKLAHRQYATAVATPLIAVAIGTAVVATAPVAAVHAAIRCGAERAGLLDPVQFDFYAAAERQATMTMMQAAHGAAVLEELYGLTF